MPVELGWGEVALRLGLAMAASFLIGLNRDERGRAVGLRTTMLVCLAATIAMLQANLLINTIGKKPDSFVVLDLMRLPLGILSGMGFIGAGAIVRRGDMAHGVTTAATLWFVTSMGICFGGGQIWLGVASCVIALITLWILRHFEKLLPQHRRAVLTLVAETDGPTADELRRNLNTAGYKVESVSVSYADQATRRLVECHLQWTGREDHIQPPEIVEQLARAPGVERLKWKPGPTR